MINNSKNRSSLGIIIDFDVLNIKYFRLNIWEPIGGLYLRALFMFSLNRFVTDYNKGDYLRLYEVYV